MNIGLYKTGFLERQKLAMWLAVVLLAVGLVASREVAARRVANSRCEEMLCCVPTANCGATTLATSTRLFRAQTFGPCCQTRNVAWLAKVLSTFPQRTWFVASIFFRKWLITGQCRSRVPYRGRLQVPCQAPLCTKSGPNGPNRQKFHCAFDWFIFPLLCLIS